MNQRVLLLSVYVERVDEQHVANIVRSTVSGELIALQIMIDGTMV